MTPPRRNRRPANQSLTPTQEVELWAWYKARKHLGTYKAKAREFGVPFTTVRSCVARMVRRERE